MLELVIRSFESFRHRAIWWIMFASIFSTIFIMLGFIWLIDHFLTIYNISNITWVEKLIENSGILAAIFFSWLLFPVAVPAIASLFEDKTAHIVEANEYGIVEGTHSYLWLKEIIFMLIGLVLNVILLPVYIIPVLNVFAYYLLNSWLVGKGLFMLVATRYYGQKGAKQLWQKHSLQIKLYGVMLVFMSTIPLLNLIAPLFGVIFMVHYSKKLEVRS